jgi:CheY-like chemotaxis protein
VARHLAGPRVLIVEDEVMISMMVEDMIQDLGCSVIGPAGDLERALALAEEEAIDVAVLDVNLNGLRSDPVADRLTERGIPFIFATGYGVAGLADAHRGVPVLRKPYDEQELARALQVVLSSSAG